MNKYNVKWEQTEILNFSRCVFAESEEEAINSIINEEVRIDIGACVVTLKERTGLLNITAHVIPAACPQCKSPDIQGEPHENPNTCRCNNCGCTWHDEMIIE